MIQQTTTMKKKVIFKDAYTLELAIKALTYVAQEKIQKKVRPRFTTSAKF